MLSNHGSDIFIKHSVILLSFDKIFYIVCKFQTIVKFVKSANVLLMANGIANFGKVMGPSYTRTFSLRKN